MRRLVRIFLHLLLALSLGLAGMVLRWAWSDGLAWSSSPAKSEVNTANNAAPPPLDAHQYEPTDEAETAAPSQDLETKELVAWLEQEMRPPNHPEIGRRSEKLRQGFVELGRRGELRAMEMLAKYPLTRFFWQNFAKGLYSRDPSAAESWCQTRIPHMVFRIRLAHRLGITTVREQSEWGIFLDQDCLQALAELSEPERNAALAGLPISIRRRFSEIPLETEGDYIQQKPLSETHKQLFDGPPADRFAAWSALPNNGTKRAALEAMLSEENGIPREQAWKFLNSLPPSKVKTDAQNNFIYQADAGMLAMLASQATDPKLRECILSRSVTAADTQAEALTILRSMAEEGMQPSLNGWPNMICSKDPESLRAACDSFPRGYIRDWMLTGWLMQQSNLDPATLVAEVRQMTSADARDHLLEDWIHKATDHPAVQDTILAVGGEDLRSRLAVNMLEKDFTAGLAAVEGFPAEQQASIAASFAKQSPGAEAATLVGLLHKGQIIELSRDWMSRAPEEASIWVESLKPGTVRDAAAFGLAEGLMTKDWDPEAAWQWAETITDETKRQAALAKLAKRWQAVDPTTVPSDLQP